MKHYDFALGMEFMSSGGLRYRCTDIGTRTILAISLEVDDDRLLEGPPYMQDEIVFDEVDMERCFTSLKEAIQMSTRKSKHPGYSSSAMKAMIKSKGDDYFRYPRKNLLRQDRLFSGDVVHPFAIRQDAGEWKVFCYLIYADRPIEFSETDFLSLVIATDENFPDKPTL